MQIFVRTFVLFPHFFALSSGPLLRAGFYEDLWLLKKTPLLRSRAATTPPAKTG